MVHDQLVDYISSQMKLGVSREAIASALVSAGWVAADVEDTIKKVESTKPAQPTAATGAASSSAMSSAKPMGATGTGMMGSSPMSTGTTAKSAAMSTGAMPTTAATATATAVKPMGTSGPQVIKVSDLVSTMPGSTVGTASSMGSISSIKKADSPVDAGKFGGKITGNSFQAATATSAPKGGSGMKIVGIVVILLLAAAAGYFYWQNTTLAAKVSSLSGSSTQVNSQLTDLQTKLNTTNSDLTNQINTLKQANDDLMLQLSFFAGAKDASTTQVSNIGGMLTTGNAKDPYKITTPRSADIYITSASGAKILTTLKSLISSEIQVAGTYIPGSDQLTVTSIISPAQPAATTSTTTTTSTTSTTKTAAPSAPSTPGY